MAANILKYIIFLLIHYCISQDTKNISDESCQYVDYSYFKNRGLSSLYDEARGYGILTNRDGCSPLKIWSLIRHGARYSNRDSITEMSKLLLGLKEDIVQSYDEGKGHLCRADIEALREFKFDELMIYEAEFLTQTGKNELFSIGNRLRDHFPSLLNTTYDPNKFYFGYSQYQRSIQSMRSFTEGLFKLDENYKSYYAGQWDNSAEMNCQFKVLATGSQLENLQETFEYSTSARLYEKIAASMSSRTGLPNSVFSEIVIISLYEDCVFGSAIYLRLSPWCRLFQLSDLQLMTDRDNIHMYFSTAHGSKNSRFFGCDHMKSITSLFEGAVQNKSDGFTMKALFSHDHVINGVFSALGCFKDSPLLSPNYVQFKETRNTRKWSLENQTPYSANMHLVLYKCGDYNDYELQIFLNEKPIGCCMSDSKESCSWSEFKKHHNDFVSNCKEDFCQEEGYDSDLFSGFHSGVLKNTPAKCFIFIMILTALLSTCSLSS